MGQLDQKIIHTILKQFDLRLVRDDRNAKPCVPLPEDRLRCFFAAIKSLGFDPKHIVDVGANRALGRELLFLFF
jgi:hypothetical protein